MPSSRWLAPLRRCLRASMRVGAQRKSGLRVEDLEARDVPAVVSPTYVLGHNSGGVTAFGSPAPTGLSPSTVRHAYGFDQVSFGGAAGDGTGTTIAIVDAYDDPTIASDLHAFDLQFGLPDPVFAKTNQTGGSTMPAGNTGWAGEIALDVEWAHAVAPGASILLVEANSATYNDLLTAVSFAARQTGVVAVSMSWGGGEFSSETSFDSTFVTPSGHAGVVFVASSGDAGAPVSYPSASPNVLSVGGTTLRLDGSGNYSSESGWGGSGGGISAFEIQPAYQNGVVTQSATRRTNPDVAYDSDPNTGFSVYQTYGNSAGGPWLQYGGTSVAAPQWAALVAIADQGRALAGQTALSSATLLPTIYQLPAADFHDVTSGTSTGSPNYTAGPGYDLVTGRGTPVANKLIADLVGSSTTSGTHVALSAPPTATAGAAFALTVTAEDASGNTLTGFTGTVHFTSSDGAAVLPTDYTFTTDDGGTHTFTVTLKTAGSDSVTAASGGVTGGSATVAVSPAAPTHLAFTRQPTNVLVGVAVAPAVTVAELDDFGNVATQDGATQITLALGANPGGATLTGGGPVTVSHGVATFTGLSLDTAGSGYTLVASGGGLGGATSAAFNVTTATGVVIETFETGLGRYYYTGGSRPQATTSSAAAHDGALGLLNPGDGDWYLRVDSAARINPGDTVSVWTRFANSADGRAYFGFGTTFSGTLSAVLAPNTGQLLIQNNAGFGFTDLASVGQSYQANHWYRVEVTWGTSGTVIVRLYDSDGQTLLNSLTVATHDTTPGGFAFRAIGSTKDWDTVSVTRGVNSFSAHAASQLPPTPHASADSSLLSSAARTGEWWAALVGPSSASVPTGGRANDRAGVPPAMFLSPSFFDWPGVDDWLDGLTRPNRA